TWESESFQAQPAQERCRHADRQVDEEDGRPAEAPQEHPADARTRHASEGCNRPDYSHGTAPLLRRYHGASEREPLGADKSGEAPLDHTSHQQSREIRGEAAD